MVLSPPGPPRYKPTPLDNAELRVHPQRAPGLEVAERRLVCVFLEGYVVWLARRRKIDEVRNALGLLCEGSRGAQAPAVEGKIDRPVFASFRFESQGELSLQNVISR